MLLSEFGASYLPVCVCGGGGIGVILRIHNMHKNWDRKLQTLLLCEKTFHDKTSNLIVSSHYPNIRWKAIWKAAYQVADFSWQI